jgi:hypothetical protein
MQIHHWDNLNPAILDAVNDSKWKPDETDISSLESLDGFLEYSIARY